MRHISRSSWADRAAAIMLLAALVAGAAGCESLQRKFTRKPKHAPKPLDPIIKFEDYTHAMTPLDKYRKHYMMFNYWNSELISALENKTPNPKRFRRASTDSLAELETLNRLVSGDVSQRFSALIDERRDLDRRLQRPGFMPSQAPAILRLLERQTREIQREFFWRDIETSIVEPSGAVAPAEEPAADAAAAAQEPTPTAGEDAPAP